MSFSKFLHTDPQYASLPSEVDEALLDERVTRLRSGDLSVASDIAQSLMRLTMGVVRQNRSNDDECIGEALLTLTESVHKASTALHDNNIIPYVLERVRMKLKDVRQMTHSSYSISARRMREEIAKNRVTPQRNSISENDYSSRKLKNLIDPRSEIALLEFRDNLDKQLKDYRQKMVIEHKLEGYTYKQISEMCEISEATAMREVHEFRERFNPNL